MELYWMQKYLPDGTEIGVSEIVTQIPSDAVKGQDGVWVTWDEIGYTEYRPFEKEEERWFYETVKS